MTEIKKKIPLIIESSSDKSSNISESNKNSDDVNNVLSSLPSTQNSSSSTEDSSSTKYDSSIEKTLSDIESSKTINSNNLEKDFSKINCSNENFYTNECNKFLLKREIREQKYLSEHPETDPYLYPNLSDTNFNIKISTKKEFYDTKYDGTIHKSIKEQSDILAKADFELSPHQTFVKNFLSFQTPYNSLLLYHGLGSGKCHAINTPIIMSDGTIKMVQDIKIGDLLMGDDSQPRTVTSLANGKDKMYNVIQSNGDTYTVNEEHILCLKATEYPKLSYKTNQFKVKWIQNNHFKTNVFYYTNEKNDKFIKENEAIAFYKKIKIQYDNIIEISIKDYLQLSNKKKKVLKGYKVPIIFPKRDVRINPYKLGFWLDSGDNINLFSPSEKIILQNLHLIDIECDNDLFINNNKNKHIPLIYKCNSRSNQLELLAGIIDSCGILTEYGYEISNKSNIYINDIIYLVRSLGFFCYKKKQRTFSCIKSQEEIWIITGNENEMNEIPTQILRNSNNLRKKFIYTLDTDIVVEYVKEDNYYGFTLDGNCRYLMGDFTVTHNTCSAIGVCEEMRDYMKQMGITKRIMIVASENVQDNFKLQLFDERKLKLVDGIWNIRACTGNKLLQEINPMNMKGIPKEKVISQIKNIINTYYIFLGYGQFANYIIKTMNYSEELEKEKMKRKEFTKKPGDKTKIQTLKDIKITLNNRIIRRLRNEFDNRLIVIDEVHNIRKTDDNENKKVAINLELLVKSAENMRFLLLSATPMYNSYKEIIWLLNLMNTNDRRSRIEVKDIFDKNGVFKKNGKELLTRKATGYISFVRGENPYTFPYRVYPNDFAKEHTFPYIKYPSYQMNLKKIKNDDKKRILSLYLNTIGNCENCGKCQACAYKYIIYNLRNKSFSITTKLGVVREMPSFENMESFGYTLLQTPLESLIISYPVPGLKIILDKISNETYSEELSESFSESTMLDETETEGEQKE